MNGARALAVALACLAATGCMYTYGQIEHPDWRSEVMVLQNARAPLGSSISFRRRSELIGLPGYDAVTRILADGPFSARVGRDSNTDLVAEIAAIKRTQHSPLLPLALLTLLVIPTKTDYHLDLDVDILDQEQKIVKRYRRTTTLTTWVGWIFLWGPFVHDRNAEMNGLIDMARSIVREIYTEDYEMFRAFDAASGSHRAAGEDPGSRDPAL